MVISQQLANVEILRECKKMTLSAIDLIELIFSQLSLLSQRTSGYLELRETKYDQPIKKSVKLNDTLKHLKKLFSPQLRLEKRKLIIAYTDIDFAKFQLMVDLPQLYYALIYLVSHSISQASDSNLKLIIGYSKPLELLQIHIKAEPMSTDNRRNRMPVIENQEESIDLELCRKIVEHNGGKLERLTQYSVVISFRALIDDSHRKRQKADDA